MDKLQSGAIKIRLRAVAKHFNVRGRRIDALAPIDCEIRAGEFYCIVGPSGCGKTTLLRILAGLEARSAGRIEIAGAVAKPPRRGTKPPPLNAMVFQETSIFPWMNVRDNVAFGLKARRFSRRDRYAIVDPFIRSVGLGGFEDALPHQLSGGMKQRVSIARAFANDPELLLMDEPFAALDEQTRMTMGHELLRIWSTTKKTVVFITHSLTEAVYLADEVLVMSARPGRIIDHIQVTLPRPRTYEMMATDVFGRLRDRIWQQIRKAD